MPLDESAVGVADEPEIPRRYAVTRRYLALRACERFGLAPKAWRALDPAEQAELLVYDRVRRAEERALAEAQAGGALKWR